jgi:hypothetical protein
VKVEVAIVYRALEIFHEKRYPICGKRLKSLITNDSFCDQFSSNF